MKTRPLIKSKLTLSVVAGLGCLFAVANPACATVRHVDVNSASPMPPYTNWSTAATTIQAAIDAAAAGDEVVVTNGVYATGGRAVVGTMTNRVTVGKAMTVRSVNGPQFTMIQGRQVSVTSNGTGAIRCVYLASGATLSGFTLTNGATRTEGEPELEQSGGGLWCGSTNAAVSNCVLAGNSASYNGGGAYRGTLNNCTLTGNSAGSAGGGAYLGAQNGINGGTLNNCTLSGNSAAVGGGAYLGTLNNCLLTGNSAGSGGGATGGTLNNCTLTGNSAAHGGGGADTCTVNNCIVFFNTAAQDANYSPGTLNYCCTTPLPTYGIGNIALNPQLASGSHLSVGSPCRGAGSNDYAAGTDIDGEAWASPPSIGCDEFHAGAVTGPLGVGIVVTLTNFAAGYPVGLTALIAGRTTVSTWDFGDGVGVTNQPYTTHVWTAPGDYMVVLRAYNESHPAGVSANLTVHVRPPVHYVATDSGNPVSPYVSWATAASTLTRK